MNIGMHCSIRQGAFSGELEASWRDEDGTDQVFAFPRHYFRMPNGLPPEDWWLKRHGYGVLRCQLVRSEGDRMAVVRLPDGTEIRRPRAFLLREEIITAHRYAALI